MVNDSGDSGSSRNVQTEAAPRWGEQLANTIADGAFQLDDAERIVAVNDALIEMAGYTREDLLGEHVAVLFDEASVVTCKLLHKRLRKAEDESVETASVTLTTADDKQLTCTLRLRLVTAGEERAVCVLEASPERDTELTSRRRSGDIVPSVTTVDRVADALETTLQRLCQETRWIYGDAWVPTADGQLGLVTRAATTESGRQFGNASASIQFASGEGLVGRVYETGKPEWMPDTTVPNSRFVRAEAAEEHRLKAALGVPVTDGSEVLAVLTLLLDERAPTDVSAVEFASAVAAELGSVLAELRAEREEWERSQQFQPLVENVTEYGIFMLDPDGTVTSWNEGAKRIKGYTADEIVGKHFSQFYTERDRNAGRPEKNLTTAAMEGQVEDEGWRVRADGSRFWATVVITARYDEDGELEGYTKVTRDTTDRREYERQLQEERDLTRRILEAAPVDIRVVTRDGEIVRTNDHATDRLGLDGRETSYLSNEHDIFDEDGQRLAPDERPHMRVFETGEPRYDEQLQVDVPGTGGGRRWLSINAVPIRDGDGAVEQVVITADDITPLKEQSRQLERERNSLRLELDDMFERITDAFYALDDSFTFTYVNDRAEELLQKDESELLGTSVWEIFPTATETPAWDAFHDALETQEPTSFEVYYDPLGFWVEARVYPSESGLSVYFRDVTERKERTLELERYETIVETANDGIYTIDEHGQFTFVNDAYTSIAGHSREELLGSHVSMVADEETIEQAAELHAQLERGDRETASLETKLERPDGTTVDVEATFAIVHDDGRHESVGIVRDITERKERERKLEESRRRYETLVENFPNGVVTLVDEDLRYIIAGGQGFDLFSFTAEEITGERLTTCLPDDLREQLRPQYEAALEGESRCLEMEIGDRTIETRTVPVRDEDGTVFAGMGMSQDVTEQREREKQLERRVKQQEVVTQLGQRALESDDLGALFEAATERVAETLSNDYCKILEHQPDEDRLRLRDGVGWRDGLVGNATVGTQRDSQAGYTLESDEPVVVDDLRREKRFSGPELLTSHDVVSGISVCIGSSDDPWGVLGTHDTDRVSSTEQDINFVQAVANILATAIERVNHEREIERQRERLAALNNLNEIVRDIIGALIQQPTRKEVEALVCDRLAASDSYAFAWIGEVDSQSDGVLVRTEAGVENYLADTTITVTDNETGNGPTGRAFRTGEMQICQNVLVDPEYRQWREQAQEYGYRSSAAIPIRHGNTIYGVLNLYAERPAAFGGEERDVLEQLGAVIGHVMNAIQRRRVLMSDEIVEVEFQIRNVFTELDIPGEAAGAATISRVVPVGKNTYIAYGTTDDDGIELLSAMTETQSHWDELTVLTDGFDGHRFEIRLVEAPVLTTVDSYGGRIRTATIENGDYHMIVELPPDAPVRDIVKEIQAAYPAAEMIAQQTTHRGDREPISVPIDLPEILTDRQLAAIEAAYFAGFFEWPRGATGEEVADSLEISPPTFHQHLRAAERRILNAIMENDGRSGK